MTPDTVYSVVKVGQAYRLVPGRLLACSVGPDGTRTPVLVKCSARAAGLDNDVDFHWRTGDSYPPSWHDTSEAALGAERDRIVARHTEAARQEVERLYRASESAPTPPVFVETGCTTVQPWQVS